MRFDPPLIAGTLVRRYKRFLADMTLADGTEVVAHCPNTGSMAGCNVPGSPVYLSRSDNPKRKLAYTWELVQVGNAWVGIHTGRVNVLISEAIQAGSIPELLDADGKIPAIRPEVKYGTGSRIDLLLTGAGPDTYVEIKNTTLAEGSQARFPDAVTTRGQKHMRELATMVTLGHRAAVVFLVHRPDCERFSPADAIDPDYGIALRAARDAGVMVLPYRARVAPEGVVLQDRLPVDW